MKKMKSETPSEAAQAHTNTGSNGADGASPATKAMPDPLVQATRWVQEHQAAALAGAFGLGVFIGVLLRSE